jgi:hypothetical protein
MYAWWPFVVVGADTLVVSVRDSLTIGNWPTALLRPAPSVWIATVLPVFASAALSFLAAQQIYRKERRDRDRDKKHTAFHLYYAICDEMARAREGVWHIIVDNQNRRHLKAPFVLDARDHLLGRLADTLPPGHKISAVLRFYGLLALVALHHNRGAALPVISGNQALLAVLMERAGVPQDAFLESVRRDADDARLYARAFALRHYEHDEEDSLTSLYIEAVQDLKCFAREIGVDSKVEFALPTEAERDTQRATIAGQMAPAAGDVQVEQDGGDNAADPA